MLLTGSQIVGPNSVVTLEIEAETSLTEYGDVQILYVKGTDAFPTVGTFTMGSTSPAVTGKLTLLDGALASPNQPALAIKVILAAALLLMK